MGRNGTGLKNKGEREKEKEGWERKEGGERRK